MTAEFAVSAELEGPEVFDQGGFTRQLPGNHQDTREMARWEDAVAELVRPMCSFDNTLYPEAGRCSLRITDMRVEESCTLIFALAKGR